MKKILLLVVILSLINEVVLFGKRENLIIVSIPKAGTHIINKLLRLLSNEVVVFHDKNFIKLNINDYINTSILSTHLVYDKKLANRLETMGYKGILMIRDPRDQAVSFIYYAKKMVGYPVWLPIQKMPFDDALLAWIQNSSMIYNGKRHWCDSSLMSLKGIDDFYYQYLQWKNHAFMYVTSFEKLVGSKGGGSRKVQIDEIINIANHLGIAISNTKAEFIADQLWGGTGTFRKGAIGSWKSHFKPIHIQEFKKIAGSMLVDLSYEVNFNW